MINTTSKRILTLTIFLLLLVTSLVVYHNWKNSLHIKVIKSGQGYGYDVLQGKKTIIHQPYMPVIVGQEPFRERKAARKTGELVVKKLKTKQSPGISLNELNEIIKENK
jgi:hypothetical protein